MDFIFYDVAVGRLNGDTKCACGEPARVLLNARYGVAEKNDCADLCVTCATKAGLALLRIAAEAEHGI